MEENIIKVRGARVHNLKDIDVDIPIGKITCITGPSGSGKSSFAFHTLYGESKRRYLNSFPSYLKFFSERPPAVEVDQIYPVFPAFGLHQINPVMGARSMVVDVMGLTPLLQNFYYRHSQMICPVHKKPMIELSVKEQLENLIKKNKGRRFYLFVEKKHFTQLYSGQSLPSYSYGDNGRGEFREDDNFWEFARFSSLNQKNAIEEMNKFIHLNITEFKLLTDNKKLENISIKGRRFCPICHKDGGGQKRLQEFSPYNALGACKKCHGHGANLEYDYEKFYNRDLSVNDNGISILKHKKFSRLKTDLIKEMKKKKYSLNCPIGELPRHFLTILHEGGEFFPGFSHIIKYLEKRKYKPYVRILIRSLQKEVVCTSCEGTRLTQKNNYFGVKNEEEFLTLKEVVKFSLDDFFKNFKVDKKIDDLVKLACRLGLGHLQLLRKTKTLSAGEYQRLLLLKYLSFNGTSSLFVFDEPSLGLSLIEKKSLWKGFQKLIDQGNTVVIVDHSEYFLKWAHEVIYFGPGAGELGGEIINGKKLSEVSLNYPQIKKIPVVSDNKKGFFGVKNPIVYGNNFPSLFLPYKKLSLITGASGSGKTAVITHTLANELRKLIGKEPITKENSLYDKIYFDHSFSDIGVIDANLNRYTSRSSVGSMLGFSTGVRKHFARTPQAQSMGLKDGHFSANSKLGQCSVCEGKGVLTVEMQFLEDVVMECDNCKGKKLEPKYAHVSDGKYEAWEVFEKPFSEVASHFKLTPKFKNLWEYMKLLKIDYLSLNRTMMSLSGGERQRLYLLSKMSGKLENQLLIFENLSFGLSSREMAGVGQLLLDLIDKGNTIVLIDQNPLFEGFAHYKVSF